MFFIDKSYVSNAQMIFISVEKFFFSPVPARYAMAQKGLTNYENWKVSEKDDIFSYYFNLFFLLSFQTLAHLPP